VASKAYINGLRAEQDFKDTYSHLIERKSLRSEDMYLHVDFWLKDGRTVDVKSNSKVNPNGHVCVEFVNVRGDAGWCHPLAFVDLIAFQLPDQTFKIVLRQDLINLCNCTIPRVVYRVNGSNSNKWERKVLGRCNRKDVFTYIPIKDILKLKQQL
jgi:hypothetical protein